MTSKIDIGMMESLTEISLAASGNGPSRGYDWLSWLQVQTDDLCPASHPPAPPGPSLQINSGSVHPPGYMIAGIVPAQVQHLAFGLLKTHEIPTGNLLKLVEVPLDDILFSRCFNPSVYVINEDIK
ncbi:hypothetical protein WISP_136841 [Willisornis vidua]|uniref:Uncharacterized protein n=1 Tax=Willisornis vidua TaxID=1566151 RepID=A0ABQ9CSP0_9PASS|nr:hypothetical protein WISP_136841 [Willisornis vidua]